MSRIAPVLAVVLIAVGIWIEIVHVPAAQPASAPPRFELRTGPSDTRPADRATPPIVTQPFAESQPASRPESTPYKEVVLFEIVREDGTPIPGASLEVRVGEERLTATADDAGLAEIEARPGVSAEVEVWGATFGTALETLVLDAGRVRYVVPTRASFAGTVTVDGRTPEEPVALMFVKEEPVSRTKVNLGEHTLATDSQGRFELFNLPEAWHAHLNPPAHLEFASGEMERLTALLGRPVDSEAWVDPRWVGPVKPSTDVILRLTESPVIKGRILASGTRETLPGLITAALAKEDHPIGAIPATFDFYTDGDGRFRIPVGDEYARVTLVFTDAQKLRARTIEVMGPFDRVRNLGDVELGPVRTVRFIARDRDGNPVSGAIGAVTSTWSKSAPTDGQGASWLTADESIGSLRVAKVGYKTASVLIPTGLAEPLHVTLEPGNQLVIRAQMPDGSAPPPGLLFVQLSSSEPMFSGPDGWMDPLFFESGASESLSEMVGKNSISFVVNGAVPIILAGFLPGTAITADLRGSAMQDLADRRHVMAPAEGIVEVTLRATSWPQTFRGRVRTSDGAPIEQAIVAMRTKDGPDRDFRILSRDGGEFACEGIFADVIDFSVGRWGFVSIHEENVPIPPPGAERDFVLVRSHDVAVEVFDESGVALAENGFIAWRGPGTIDSEYAWYDFEGSMVLEGLDAGTVEVAVLFGTALVAVLHDSRVPYLRMTVPNDGVARIGWPRLDTDPFDSRLAIYPLGAMVATIEATPDPSDPEPAVEATLRPGVYFAAIESFDEELGAWVALATSPAFEIGVRAVTDVEIAR